MTGVPHTEWPPKGAITPIHGLVLEDLKKNKSSLASIEAVACDARSRTPGTLDIFLYHKWDKANPIGIVALTDSNYTKLVPFLQELENAGEDALESETAFVEPPCPYETQKIPYDHVILTCAHVKRDMRCGYCGSLLYDQFTQEIEKRGLKKVFAGRVSHVGGHGFAGNVIVYPEGAWYGYIRPADVPRIFDDHMDKGVLLVDKLRGKMGLSKTEAAELAANLAKAASSAN